MSALAGVVALCVAGIANATIFTLAAPIAITGTETGNSGVIGTLSPTTSEGSVVLTSGTTDFNTTDVLIVVLSLTAGSVDELGIGTLGSVPIVPNPAGAGTLDGAGSAPGSVSHDPFVLLSGTFDFSGDLLTAGETSARLFVTYSPGGSALSEGTLFNFMISSPIDFTVQGTITELPEPGTALLLLAGVGLAMATRRR